MGAWESIMHAALVVSFLLGGLLVPIVGGRGAYAVGGVTGVIGTLLLLPLLRWLPRRDAATTGELAAGADARSLD
jgi:hypothetical protein